MFAPPHPLRTILAATDLAATAPDATDRAALLARANAATLSLLHVVSGSALDRLRRLAGAETSVEVGLLDAARRELHERAAAIEKRHGLHADELLASGAVVEEIIAAARRGAADLIVVGAHAAGSMMKLLLGSTTARLLRTSRCPVLVVRRANREPYRRVLVPLDFSDWSSETIELARQVAPGANLLLLHAWELPFEGTLHRAGVDAAQIEPYRHDCESDARERLARFANDHGLAAGDWTAVTAQGSVRERILEAERRQHCDLIAIGQHGRNFSEALLMGSATQHVTERARGDVLVSTGRGPGKPPQSGAHPAPNAATNSASNSAPN